MVVYTCDPSTDEAEAEGLLLAPRQTGIYKQGFVSKM